MKGTVDHTTQGEGCAAKKTKNRELTFWVLWNFNKSVQQA